ncbi:MAG TPA: IS256 family transposase [Longimicrobium sp.]|nr:IS256 family transposase [Longimicrobium sp.]
MAFETKATNAGVNEQAPPDLLRAMLAQVMQAAIQAEFDRFMGAGPWERTGERRGWRNGSKRRRLHTRVGTIELRIPKDREGRFQPSLFERYQRSEKAFVLALVEMYIQGVSTRKVQKVVGQLCGVLVSASQVSALVKGLDGELETWRKRSLAGQKYPYLVVDAHFEKVRREGRVLSTAVLWVIGISETGYREHLGVWTGPSESRESWVRVFRDLTQRGLEGVEYVVSDEHAGLVQALGLYFPEAAHQRCQVHYMRNALSYVSTDAVRAELITGLRDAWAAPTREEARARIARLIDTMRAKVPTLAEWLEETAEQTLACYELPAGVHRLRLRSTNSVEHDHADIRRRTRVVRIFPNDASLVRLASALAMERNEQWMERRYFIMPDAPQSEPELRQSA